LFVPALFAAKPKQASKNGVPYTLLTYQGQKIFSCRGTACRALALDDCSGFPAT